jgi:hypothetical protein
MNRAMTWIFLAAALLAFGCNEDPKGLATPPAGGQPAAAPINDDDLATPADFDDEAEKAITEANYKTELDTLEKEIDSEP